MYKRYYFLCLSIMLFVGSPVVMASVSSRVLESGYVEITQRYRNGSHYGIDMVRDGYLLDSITAHSDGTVIEVINNCVFNTPDDPTNPGNMIVIDHGNGFYSRYLHLEYGSIRVKVGDIVSQGQVLGYMGNTGYSFGGHLHFELMLHGRRIDPTYYLNRDLVSPISVYYRVKTIDHGWLPEVMDLTDYAGYENSLVTDIAIGVSEGSIRYRVHLLHGDWLPYVSGYDIYDYYNGYAGKGEVIDAIEAYYEAPEGYSYLKVRYSVNDYSYQYDNEVTNGMDGYAGLFGKAITKLQMIVS